VSEKEACRLTRGVGAASYMSHFMRFDDGALATFSLGLLFGPP
jgi:hypothetical protein